MEMEQHFESSESVQDMVIGMSDGLTVPFALAAGLSGADIATATIVTAGVAEIIAGSIAMGLGGYLAGTAEINHFDAEERREYYEVDHFPEKEKQEVMDVFEDYGLSKHLQIEIAEELSKDKKKWVEFMMRFELDLKRPAKNRPFKSGATIALSYIVGGTIPLIPYIVYDNSITALKISSIVTLIALFAFGIFKSRVTGQPLFKGALKVAVIGAIAAIAAFSIAKLIGG
ncbi:MAG: VIT1/CCC1 transporter family protein [Flavobacteriales bacterium]|nr:VIT1/CCC1 transporter family protein [Flavobacteriales bacterium]